MERVVTEFFATYLLGLDILGVGFRILLATILGGIIGFNRARHGRAAGLRTHILVCVGAALTALTGLYVNDTLGFVGDPMRLGAQVITGIGFLGAGIIMNRNGSQVIGLTTAAGVWTTACLGLAIGSGFYLGAILGFAAIMISVAVLGYLEFPLKAKGNQFYYLEVEEVNQVNSLLETLGEALVTVEIQPAKSGISGHVGVICTIPYHSKAAELMEQARACEYVCLAVPMDWKAQEK